MAYQLRSDMYAPALAKNFATLTAADFGGADNPTTAKHLPCGVVSSAGGVFTFATADGTVLSTTLLAGVYYPIAPAKIDVTSVAAVTVFWQLDR